MSFQAPSRRLTKLVLDLTVLAGVFGLAFVIRFEGSLSGPELEGMAIALPLVLLVKLLCFTVFGVRRLTWRFISLVETKRIFLALALAAIFLISWRLTGPAVDLNLPAWHAWVPLGVLLIDLPLSFLGIVGLRLAFRVWVERREKDRPPGEWVPTVLIGAGRAAALVARELTRGKHKGIRPLGFVDGNPAHVGQLIHGLPILGTLDHLSRIVREHHVKQALITPENNGGISIRQMLRRCEACGIPAKIIPEIGDMVEGMVNLSTIRDVAIEDLLRREPIQLDEEAIGKFIRGQRVLITGAGGSIGSELCRVVCRFRPSTLILLEQAENGLFFMHRELGENFPQVHVVPVVADIYDKARVKDVFAAHRPAVVFHAAAHKHVPLMECNPGEAIKNNVRGTQILADVADAFGVSRFVMISTDKAVNPSSVMGVSKRVAEIYIQALSQRSRTRFVAVRFGNVLGSTGSVLPIFKQQIARGGPVTVTHPEMRRYFMTTPEACQLVLQAASMGRGGEIFLLDMGEPVRIVDLARDLIRLSGLQPDRDIEIHFTGIRPGEKLFEELTLEEENASRTHHPQVFIGKLKTSDLEKASRQIDELCALAHVPVPAAIYAKFKEIVPEYCFEGSSANGEEKTPQAGLVHHEVTVSCNGSPSRDTSESRAVAPAPESV